MCGAGSDRATGARGGRDVSCAPFLLVFMSRAWVSQKKSINKWSFEGAQSGRLRVSLSPSSHAPGTFCHQRENKAAGQPGRGAPYPPSLLLVRREARLRLCTQRTQTEITRRSGGQPSGRKFTGVRKLRGTNFGRGSVIFTGLGVPEEAEEEGTPSVGS